MLQIQAEIMMRVKGIKVLEEKVWKIRLEETDKAEPANKERLTLEHLKWEQEQEIKDLELQKGMYDNYAININRTQQDWKTKLSVATFALACVAFVFEMYEKYLRHIQRTDMNENAHQQIR